jgi:hypothetical protein
VLATNMSSGKKQIVTQKVGEVLSRLYLFLDSFAVNRQLYLLQCHSQVAFCVLRHASVNARRVKTFASDLR